MTKLQFLISLRDKLSCLPQDEVEEHLNFYSEMIEDRMEEGLSEEEAVSAVGSIEEISAQTAADIPHAKNVQENKTRRHLKVWEIILLVLGFPIWLSLLITAFAVLFSLYALLWSVVVCLWATFASIVGCALAGTTAGTGFALVGNTLSGIAMIGAGIICAGLAIFLFFACKAATNGTMLLTKRLVLWIKNSLIKKEEAQCVKR